MFVYLKRLNITLRPKAIVDNMAELAKVKPTGRVDVNKIDLGIEYSGRFTNLLVQKCFRTEVLMDNKFG